MTNTLQALEMYINSSPIWTPIGRVSSVSAHSICIVGLQHTAEIGQQVKVFCSGGAAVFGEVVRVDDDSVEAMLHSVTDGILISSRVALEPKSKKIFPSSRWFGRVIDPFGRPFDGRRLPSGSKPRSIHAAPPNPTVRAPLGARLYTGHSVMNTFLPIVEGQRIGLFAGAGVGKSTLLANLCKYMDAEVIVIAMIGERGREVRQFVDETLGPDGMKRTVVVAATSDQSALSRRRCAQTAMAVAEHFRDEGRQVLLLADSITRFAEAHREIALATGELPALRGYPPSTTKLITSLIERAGPGETGSGCITAIFTVLVAGSDFDEPVADILRGVLDGHVVLDREIAERGRFPAIDLLRSVSRSLPDAASDEENAIIAEARTLVAAYENAKIMIEAGLYVQGTDRLVDRAVRIWPDLDSFIGKLGDANILTSFQKLQLILRRSM